MTVVPMARPMTEKPRVVRVVLLPSGRSVTLGAYVIAWRQTTEVDPDALVRDWDHFPTTVGAIRKAMRRGMHDRINHHLPWWGKGRRWDSDWQRAAHQLASRVNGTRIITRPGDVPKDLRARLAHRITQPWEE